MDSAASSHVLAAINLVHYVYPIIVLLYFIAAAITRACSVLLQAAIVKEKTPRLRRDVLLSLMLFMAASYVIEAVNIGIFDAIRRGFGTSQDYDICVLSSILVWGIVVLQLAGDKDPVWFPYIGCWLIGVVSEAFLVIAQNIVQPPRIWIEYVSLVLQAFRLCALGLLLTLYLELRTRKEGEDPEQQSFIRRALRGTSDSGYGTAEERTPLLANDSDHDHDHDNDDDLTDSVTKRKAEDKRAARLAKEGSWFTYAKSFWIFFPLVWPVGNKKLQTRALGVVGCLLFSNAMKLMVPIQFGIMCSALIGSGNTSQGPWKAVGLYALLRILNTGSFVGALRKYLWLPLELYARDSICIAAYNHVMSLSSDFHDSKSTSEVTHVLHRGLSVKNLLEKACFDILPMFVDLSVAVVYLYLLFGPYMILVAFAQIVVYLSATSRMISAIRPLRRLYLKWWKREHVISSEGLGGWANAVHFNNIQYENERYGGAIKNVSSAERTYTSAFEASSVAQGFVLSTCLSLALYIGAYQVLVLKTRSLGDFITLVSYWDTLNSPLWVFADLYKNISDRLLDAEALLELFETKPTVFDLPDAKPLEFLQGSVTFENVSFSYDEQKPTLREVSFHIPGGNTVALVGETGGGKTTILKLLTRFYDVREGSVKIDGQNVCEVTLDSLRECIGSVPQDPGLFNDSILKNVKYGKLDASNDEVYEACKAACIHDKIMTFPRCYKSVVGDKGVKLSGGEKQRIAIARAILKNPKIIILDEATSAVDTETEALIQEALAKLCSGRTTLIVAHRLSTIMKADRILVMKEGAIIEEGSHDVLLKKCGKYHDLWSRQIFLKSLDKPEQPQSPSQPLANIVNDVDPSRGIIKLSKALKTTDVAHNKSRVSKKLKGPGDIQKEEDQGTDENSLRKSLANLARKASKKAGKQIARTFDASGGETAQSSAAQSESKEDEGDVSASGTNSKILEKTRSSKRHQSKSEPPAQGAAGQAYDSIRRATDGTQDTEITGSGSGDSSLPLAPAAERRSSAPSDPPPSDTIRDMRGPSICGRSRRPRHWRLRKHSHDPSLSVSTSGSGSAEHGNAAGAVAPVTTPTDAPPLIAPRIRFAPGF